MTRRDELRERLGFYAVMSRRELDALAAATAEEELAAVVYAVWNWKGWIAAATDGGLYLSRRPRVLGRRRDESWRWDELVEIRSGGTLSVDLDFGSDRVELRFIGPHDEYVALLEAARGPGEVTTEEIRELARTKLGSRLAFGYEATIDGLRDRLAPDERVERLAVATRVHRPARGHRPARCCCSTSACARSRAWEAPRDEIRQLELVEPYGLRLTFGSEAVTFTDVTPSDRRDELAAVAQVGSRRVDQEWRPDVRVDAQADCSQAWHGARRAGGDVTGARPRRDTATASSSEYDVTAERVELRLLPRRRTARGSISRAARGHPVACLEEPARLQACRSAPRRRRPAGVDVRLNIRLERGGTASQRSRFESTIRVHGRQRRLHGRRATSPGSA